MFTEKLLLSVRNFKNDVRGTFTLFVVGTFSTMVLAAGFAWDVIRFEAMRTHVQLVIDNAALAAAALDQAIDPETGEPLDPIEVANNYINSVKMPYDVDFDPVAEINTSVERKVNITADASIGTFFLNIAGTHSLDATLVSTGYEKYAKVEVSLVLDISGSMGSSTKIGALKTAAANFVTTMLAGNSSATPNLVSINLIPYSTYVNMGPGMFAAAGMSGVHSDLPNAEPSYCVSFSGNAFTSADMPNTLEMAHVTNFGYTNYYNLDDVEGNNLSTSPYCTTQDWAHIAVMSNDVDALTTQIGNLQATTQTSIDDGVKWGAALLDPSANTLVNNMIALPSGHPQKVDSGFADRPVAYGTDNSPSQTTKILVVMTDGVNTTQYNMKSQYSNSLNPYSMSGSYYNENTDSLRHSYKSGSDWKRLSWAELWSIETVRDYASSKDRGWSTYMTSSNTGSNKDARLNNICSAAKNAGTKIYTIAYETTQTSGNTMFNCSNGHGYFHAATESTINDVFSNISSGIKKLQLTD